MMNIFKALFGGESSSSDSGKTEEYNSNEHIDASAETVESNEEEASSAARFDMFKYDGVRAAKMGQYAYAVKCFAEALDIKDDLETRDHLAQSLIRLGELSPAIEQLQILHEAEPENTEILKQMARVFYMLEDYSQMNEVCEKAMSIDNNDVRTHLLQAQARLGAKDMISAIALLTRAITLESDFADAYLLRGQTLLDMGDAAHADEDASWLMERIPEHEDVLMLKARVERAKGNTNAAIELYSKVIDVNPFCVDAFKERGALHYQQGDTKAAQTDVKMVLELEPQSMADVNGKFSADGVEQHVRQAYSNINPLGL